MTDRTNRRRRTRRPAPPTPIGLSKEAAGARLRRAREAPGRTRPAPLSAAEAAARLGVGVSRLGHVETGRKVLTWPRLLHWIAALDLDPRIVLPELFEKEMPDEPRRTGREIAGTSAGSPRGPEGLGKAEDLPGRDRQGAR